jgi:hypothetical protein
MPTIIDCPTCGMKHKVPDDMGGRSAQCRGCKATFTIPGAEEDAPMAEMVNVRAKTTNTKECPFCSEQVNATAKKCKHCGETIDVALRMAEDAKKSFSPHGPVFMNAGGGGAAASSSAAVSERGERYRDRPERSFAIWHVVHLVLTLATCGFWLPVWGIHFFIWISSK